MRAGVQRGVGVAAEEANAGEAVARGQPHGEYAWGGWQRLEALEMERREPEGEPAGGRTQAPAAELEATGEVKAEGWREGVGWPKSIGRLEVEPRRHEGSTSRDANVEGLARGEVRGRREDTRGHGRGKRRRERDVHAKVHERERERRGSKERATHESEREREHTHTRVRRDGVCLLYRGTRMIWKGRGSRVTSCHSAVPSTFANEIHSKSQRRYQREFFTLFSQYYT